VAVVDGGHEGFLGDCGVADAGGWGAGQADDGDVEAAIAEEFEEVVGVGFAQRDLDGGVSLVECGEQVGEVGGGAGDHHADRDPAADQAGQFVDGEAGGVDSAERGPGVGEHRRAGLGEADGAAGAVE
jgi:hypothetical protein